jgi:hypothetical protein
VYASSQFLAVVVQNGQELLVFDVPQGAASLILSQEPEMSQ